MTQIKKKLLYFDIDGTILDGSTKAVKENLKNGQLEIKIKKCHFDKIFCVGSVNDIFKDLENMGQHVDNTEIVYTLCFDAFTDYDWFVSSIHCLKDSDQQIYPIEFDGDWWYMDCRADNLLKKIGKYGIFTQQVGKRILIPNPTGDGQDIISWLDDM